MPRVLVVEDEPGIVLGLEDALRLEGYEVEVADNGLDAGLRASRERFDLILLDVMLPGRNGFDVCRDLRRSGVETPVIFLTARTQEDDRVSGLDFGANDYVTKPYSSRELMARVRSALRVAEGRGRDRRLETEMAAAANVQRRLLPVSLPHVDGLDYAGVCRPAFEVSGDYYDFFALPSGRLALVLADVSGKGMPAALLAASLHAAVRAYAPDAGCGGVVERINRLLFETTSPERFATMVYAVYDPAERTLTWTNAGHCAPIWVHGASCARLESLTPPLGLFPDVPAAQQTIRLEPGGRLVVFSDGVPEARSPRGVELGETRLATFVTETRKLSASLLCDAMLAVAANHAGGDRQADDQTVMAVLTER